MASTRISVGVFAVMAAISVSGTENFTFTLLMSRRLTTGCEGNAVSPAAR